MKPTRVIFVLLILVGVCGAVYVALTVGLAAYLRYQAGAQAETGSDLTAGHAEVAHTASRVHPASNPIETPSSDPELPEALVELESANQVRQRIWATPRNGLSIPPAFIQAPSYGSALLTASGSAKGWLPAPSKLLARPIEPLTPTVDRVERHEIPATFLDPAWAMPSDGSQRPAISLPQKPLPRVESDDPARVRVSSIARPPDQDRPAAGDDPTQTAGETLMLGTTVPMPSAPAKPVRLTIPDPGPGDAGQARTKLNDDDPPADRPSRPQLIKLPVK